MTSLMLLLFGVLLLCMPLFRQDFFVRHSTIFPLFFILFPIGLTLILWAVSGQKFRRLAVLLGICIIVEASLVGSIVYMAYFQRIAPLPESYFYWVREQYSFFKGTTNFDSGLSDFDPELGYRFRPGITGRFTNPEFNVEIKANSLGVRDDEASLTNPPIVVLGDSHGMGWGVEQSSRFSEVIEQQCHVKVLNTALTSYGTYRETKLLNLADLDSCRLLIIQYCENDLAENQANLPVPQKSGIDAISFQVAGKQNTINKSYFPFKGIFLSLRWLFTKKASDEQPAANQASVLPVASAPKAESAHAAAFFPYLAKIREVYKGPIIVFDLGMYNYPVVKEFEAYQAAHPASDVHFFNVHPLLSRRDYFTIDDHINSSGHGKIGNALAGYIKENKWLEKP
jgi:hypothetical protein